MLTIFNKERTNIWEFFALEIKAKFIKGISWRSDRTEINHNGRKIIFDNYTLWSGKYGQIMTRVVAPIVITDNFRFEIYRQTFPRNIGKIFGAQDIEIGRPDFDKEFIIKSNNGLKIKTLLQNQEIRHLIFLQKEVNIEISDHKGVYEEKLPENHFELSFYADGEIKDIEQLKSLLGLFKAMLDKLDEMKAIATP
ncbi:hypothetical protein [Flavobacterium humi]|uniref:DUF3137 domain-containing protein n=1 Tax=Flavobacterium humi TaxID=2562683 RepID=A0A4Z0LD50_9FLAO|nr:hypothetical protein [Flavobacterium humi]TGD59806.1 hypothetical protein E4635_02430 [Flavobacterium humi]